MQRFRIAADLSIPLDPRGPQPNAYDAPLASARPHSGEGFTLDTRLGGAVNCEVLEVIPHCHGTHTESVGHITTERFPISNVQLPVFMPCAVISVQPVGREIRANTVIPIPDNTEALIVRTLPNDTSKRTRRWEDATTPYLTPVAMQAIRDRGINHLLVDLPSVDPLIDGGRLAAHRIFWDMPAGSKELPAGEARNRTITEMIFVPDSVPDGCYLLTIQTPHIASDAVPSRPILFFLEDGE
jgi:kynurenine formamidase